MLLNLWASEATGAVCEVGSCEQQLLWMGEGVVKERRVFIPRHLIKQPHKARVVHVIFDWIWSFSNMTWFNLLSITTDSITYTSQVSWFWFVLGDETSVNIEKVMLNSELWNLCILYILVIPIRTTKCLWMGMVFTFVKYCGIYLFALNLSYNIPIPFITKHFNCLCVGFKTVHLLSELTQRAHVIQTTSTYVSFLHHICYSHFSVTVILHFYVLHQNNSQTLFVCRWQHDIPDIDQWYVLDIGVTTPVSLGSSHSHDECFWPLDISNVQLLSSFSGWNWYLLIRTVKLVEADVHHTTVDSLKVVTALCFWVGQTILCLPRENVFARVTLRPSNWNVGPLAVKQGHNKTFFLIGVTEESLF